VCSGTPGRDARVADLTHLLAKARSFRGFRAIFLLSYRRERDIFDFVFVLRCSTTDEVYLHQLPCYFFRRTLKTGIFRLVSIWHRVKFANFSSTKLKNHTGNQLEPTIQVYVSKEFGEF